MWSVKTVFLILLVLLLGGVLGLVGKNTFDSFFLAGRWYQAGYEKALTDIVAQGERGNITINRNGTTLVYTRMKGEGENGTSHPNGK